jgi:uncharacterized Zn finger protein
VQELVGERWSELGEELLAHLRQVSSFYSPAQVDVFLHEGLLDDAIHAVEKGASYDLIERVMDAAVEHRQEWVIQVARRQAYLDEIRSRHGRKYKLMGMLEGLK